MAKLQTKWLADDAVNESKVKLSNDGFLRGRNAGDSADVNIIKVNASDALELAFKLNDPSNAAPSADTQLANKKYVDDQVGAISLPSVFELQGNYNATTDSPALANTDTSVDGFLYYVNVAGSQDFGAGSLTFSVGDWVYNVNGAWVKADNNDDVLSVNGNVGTVVLDTGDISENTNLYYTQARFDAAFTAKDTDSLSEGASNFYYTQARFDTSIAASDTGDLSEGANLYFTDVRVEDATLTNYVVGANTAISNADDVKGALGKLQGQVSAVAAGSQDFSKENLTLSGGDITAGTKDLAQTPIAGSLRVFISGSPEQVEGVDYSMSGVTMTFAGDMAAELIAGDVLRVSYAY